MSNSIKQIEDDMASYKAALKQINIPEKERLESKYPVTSKYKNEVPQGSYDVMIEKILAIDSNYEFKT